MASPAPAKFRIDVDIHNLLMNSSSSGPVPAAVTGATLPEPVFPQYPELLSDPGPVDIPQKRDWTYPQVWRKVRGWLLPYMRSRIMPGEFHPITAYLFLDYKCNLDCWYCWAFDNKVKGMTEDVAKRSIDCARRWRTKSSTTRLRRAFGFMWAPTAAYCVPKSPTG